MTTLCLDRKEVRCATLRVHSTGTGWPVETQNVFFWRLAGRSVSTGLAIVHWISSKFRRNRSISLHFREKRILTKKFKMATKSGGKMGCFFLRNNASRLCRYPAGQKFCRNGSILLRFRYKHVFAFYAEI